MRLLKLLFIVFLFVASHEEIFAQESYEFIYSDSTNKQDSIIDFGASVPGNPILKTITFKNLSADTIWMKERVITYFIIREDPLNPIAGAFNEFDDLRQGGKPDTLIPLFSPSVILPPGDSLKVFIRFNADSTGEQAVIGTKSAFLEFTLRKKGTEAKVASRTFFLTALKTKNLLVAKLPVVKFDSVYVGATALKDWMVINASPFVVSAKQTFSSLSSEFGVIDTLSTAAPGPSRNIPIRLSYKPLNRGFDTAKIQADYILPVILERDTISSLITGFGAEQKIDLISATVNSVTQPIFDNSQTPDANDTIDLDNIWVGTSRRVTFEFTNQGNISFKALKDMISGDGSIDQPFLAASFGIGQSRTVDVSITPGQIGNRIVAYSIESDIASRVTGAPENALRRVVYIRFRGIAPILTSVNEVSFKELEILEDCQRKETRDFTITNTGNIALRIDPPYLESGSNGFVIANPISQPLDIQEGKSFVVKITFAPTSLFIKTDTLIISNNSSQSMIRIPLQGTGIVPQSLNLSLPFDIRVRPGTIIRIPIIGKADLLKRAARYEGIIDYDPSFLKPHFPEFVITQGTASVGATSDFDEDLKVLKIMSPVGFNANDTLAFLQFDTFLGDRLETLVGIREQSVKLGAAEDDCPMIFKDVTVQPGRVMLDSACGLSFKIGGGSGRFRFQSAVPAPAREQSEIEYEVAFPTAVNITLYDSYGRMLARPVESEHTEGIYKMVIPTVNLIPGVYFCEMRAGIYQAVQQIIVAE
ncbi:MAG: choice-of-anchor D domain-containing protein [Bacteroidota bacterium]